MSTTIPDNRRWVLQEICRNAESDVHRFERAPFSGRTVAEYLGGTSALIVALARVVETLLPSESSADPPEPVPAGVEMVATGTRHPEDPGGGHLYECCGKVGRISQHYSWCPTRTADGGD